MQALAIGKRAPEFTLPTVGGEQFSLTSGLARGPVVLVFFKISCPVCQFSLPYIERIYKASTGKNVTVLGVSQNSKKDSDFFARQYGITFPLALDDPKHYAVSNAYGLTNVPTIFYINQDGMIEVSAVGWMRSEIEEIAHKITAATKVPPIQVVRTGENVPAFSAG